MGVALLSLFAAFIGLSLLVPATRRVWVFGLLSAKYVFLCIADRIGLRRAWLWLWATPYTPLPPHVALRLLAEELGPTFIKFGQIIGSSSGIFPDAWVEEFQKCLDEVRPMKHHEVVATIEAELGPELAASLQVEPEPLACASIAQVHLARSEEGDELVIKVQRPGLRARIDADMQILEAIAQFAMLVREDAKLANPVGIVADFRSTLNEEIDFLKEAQNLDRFNEIMAELGHKHIRAPIPRHELSTEKVLVMERFSGVRVDNVAELNRRGVQGEEALVSGLRAWFQSVVFYGFFHGDVHAGNLMILDDGDIGFLDFGIVGRFQKEQRYLVTDWMIAFATANYPMLARTVVAMGGAPGDIDMDRFVEGLREVYKPLLDMNFGDFNMAEAVPDLQRVARENHMTLPREFVLITKQLLYFDRYAKLLAPTLNIFKDPRLITGMIQDIQQARVENAA